MQETKRNAQRNHGQELKRTFLEECRAAASVASVAMAHGLNANLVNKSGGGSRRAKLVAAVTSPTPATASIHYEDYVSVLLFFKYVSDKYAGDPNSLIDVPAGGSFADMLAAKGDKEPPSRIRQDQAPDRRFSTRTFSPYRGDLTVLRGKPDPASGFWVVSWSKLSAK